MESAINWRDQYTYTKDRIIYTEEQLHIPGVRVLARHLMSHAIPSLGWHYHENAFEFAMSLKGNMTFSTKTSSYKFSGGDVFISFPNEIHGTDLHPLNAGDLYWFQLDVSDPGKFLFLNNDAAADMIAQLKAIPGHIIQTSSPQSGALLKTAFELAHAHEAPSFVATHLQLFLHLVIASSKKESFRLSPDIGRTLNYILENITDELNLEELADLANLSCSQYKQKFKKQMGISPRHFINQQKIEHAKILLLDGLSVTDIAMLLNFNTSSYFSTVFKKYTSLTPREYIKKEKGKPE